MCGGGGVCVGGMQRGGIEQAMGFVCVWGGGQGGGRSEQQRGIEQAMRFGKWRGVEGVRGALR